MSVQDILNVANTMQGVNLVAYNARLLKAKKLRAKHLIAAGVANVVGSSMIKANADIIKGL